MTREEELIVMLKILKEQARKSCNDTAVLDVKIDSFIFVIDKAIEALEQEPCDDCISRQGLLNRLGDFNKWCKDGRLQGSLFAVDMIKDMPPVTPQPKTGHWIETNFETENIVHGHCSECGWKSHYYEDDVVGMNYCPNCGAKMEREE